MRLRKNLRREIRECPACLRIAEFDVYQSWEKPESKRSRTKVDLRTSAKCTECGYRVINLPD
jgi:hypothetical protein